MKKLILISIFVLAPALVSASTAGDFIVNRQSTYAVPPGTTKLLVLDLTLPGTGLTSIKIHNAGTVQQYNVSQLSIYEDGVSPGWDGDESERIRKSSSPFFDTELTGDFSSQRIFVALDISSTTYSGRTIKPELEVNSMLFSDSAFNGPTDEKIIGFERTILTGTGLPTVPVSPVAKTPEALSASTIRWHFEDRSNNEFGFKILDGNLKEVARKEEADISYIDEIGLEPDTEYSGRQVVAFNDRGEGLGSTASVFPSVYTIEETEEEVIEEPVESPEDIQAGEEEMVEEEEVEEVPEEESEPELTTAEQIREKIKELQTQLIGLLRQLIQLLQEQLTDV